ncbi:MAG: heme NO-binding domain-containing protein [Capsulimonadales bacterium]|nr:heme NO-binding domain-containing protein [Capsulimonadales bacterium]
MYGLVNLAIEQMVTETFGEATWERIRTEADVEIETFISLEAYPDELTYRLVAAASRVLDTPPNDLLERFGEYWVLYTGKAGYGYLMDPSTSTMAEFLMHLNQMHRRIGMAFPHLQPPRFDCTHITEDSLRLEYRSDRPGLAPMVRGLIRGLSVLFSQPAEIEHIVVREDGNDHDAFLIRYRSGSLHA